jgi:hypothetical protein
MLGAIILKHADPRTREETKGKKLFLLQRTLWQQSQGYGMDSRSRRWTHKDEGGPLAASQDRSIRRVKVQVMQVLHQGLVQVCQLERFTLGGGASELVNDAVNGDRAGRGNTDDDYQPPR